MGGCRRSLPCPFVCSGESESWSRQGMAWGDSGALQLGRIWPSLTFLDAPLSRRCIQSTCPISGDSWCGWVGRGAFLGNESDRDPNPVLPFSSSVTIKHKTIRKAGTVLANSAFPQYGINGVYHFHRCWPWVALSRWLGDIIQYRRMLVSGS